MRSSNPDVLLNISGSPARWSGPYFEATGRFEVDPNEGIATDEDSVSIALPAIQGSEDSCHASHRDGGLVYLVEEQANPSSDYFVLPALQAAGSRVVRCGFGDLPARAQLDGASVVFVRYVPAAWARLIASARSDLAHLIFFMDDDVLDMWASVGMPWRYRWKLIRLAARWQGWLRQQRAELWVSTPWLQEKYAVWQPRLVRPVPLPQAGDICRVFYHGTASHAAEASWLRPVMADALEREAQLSFEIVGGAEIHRLYRDLPRVSVVHPMKWPAYQAFLAMSGRHIGLAPLLDLAFNKARACTKFFDITRCGAVGIYTSGTACDGVATHGIDGLVLRLDRQAWVEAIVQLARDVDLRQQMHRNALATQVELGKAAMRDPATGFEAGENT